MFYSLNNNVYIVNGAARSCIYDFNHSRLYSINDLLAQKINLVNRGKILTGTIDDNLKSIFDKLTELGIIIKTAEPFPHQIEEIKMARNLPNFAWVEVTNKCNLKCIHCYNESDVHCDIVMSLRNFKIVIDALLNLGINRVQIIGGEPFIDKNALRKMLDYTIGKFEFIEIFTNGTLIDSEWVEFLSKNNIHVALSVYSYDATVHDKVTGSNGSWSKTNVTIEKLRYHGVEYRVCNILMKDVCLGQKTSDFYELSKEKDIVRMSGRANFSLLSEDLIRKKLITKKSFSTPINRYFTARMLSGHNCFKNKIYIAANMEVFPCVMERRLKHCTVGKNGEIKLDRTILDLGKDQIEECKQCEYRYACFDCRPNSLSGNLLEKPWYCTYNPATGEWTDEENFVRYLKEKWG